MKATFWLLLGCSLAMVSCSGKRPAQLGLRDGRLTPCPASPNCVSSQSEDARHAIDPLRYGDARQEARVRLLGVLRSMPGATIVTEEGDYIHAEFRSRLFRFVDDVEFFFDEQEGIIQTRSASRLGHSDLGVNRKRMEKVRVRFEKP